MDILQNLSVTKIISLNHLLKTPVGIKSYRKNRDSWGIALKVTGKTIYTCECGDVISDNQHPVLLPKGSNYSWTCVEPGECIIVEFDADITAEAPIAFSRVAGAVVMTAFTKIEQKLNTGTVAAQLEAKSVLYGLFATLEKLEHKEYISGDKREIIQPAEAFMQRYYYLPQINNDFLAGLCGISTVYFRKIYAMIYGVSPMKQLQNFRMEKAKAILNSDFETISQVAESVGFSSVYHFSKTFKQYTGQSPLHYIKRK